MIQKGPGSGASRRVACETGASSWTSMRGQGQGGTSVLVLFTQSSWESPQALSKDMTYGVHHMVSGAPPAACRSELEKSHRSWWTRWRLCSNSKAARGNPRGGKYEGHDQAAPCPCSSHLAACP